MIPTMILQMWFLGLLALGVAGAVVHLAREWTQRSWVWDTAAQRWVFEPQFGWNEETALLAGAVALVMLTLFGKGLVKAALRLSFGGKTPVEHDPRESPRAAAQERLTRPDGSELHVEFYGPAEGPPLVLCHGWGLDGAEWNYMKKSLSDRFRLIVWDEPGLGRSSRPRNQDYSLENLARDLEAVLGLAGKPAVLLGHSIGGMIVLTFCRLFPEVLGRRVSGLVLTHTTPTDPVRTTFGAPLLTALEKPVLVPMMYLTIALSPLVWFMNWLSYRNGSMHLMTKRSSFGGTETWEEVDFAARFQLRASPAVLARGMLAMMRYDATATLPGVSVPALVVAGDRDQVTKPEASEAIRAGIPGARLVKLTPARHLGLIEHHERYAQEVRAFVEGTAAA
jgi:pimeloyl-ACP methyl ester carboxylesterase